MESGTAIDAANSITAKSKNCRLIILQDWKYYIIKINASVTIYSSCPFSNIQVSNDCLILDNVKKGDKVILLESLFQSIILLLRVKDYYINE